MTLRPSDTPTADRRAEDGDHPDGDDGGTVDGDRRPAPANAPTDGRDPTDRVGPSEAVAPVDFADLAAPAHSVGYGSPDPRCDADRFLAAVAVDGEVLFAGPSTPAVLGVDRESVVGSDFRDRVHPSDRESVADAMSAVATTRTVSHRLRTASGGYAWVESVVDEDLAPEFGGRVVTVRRIDADRTFPERYRAFLEYGTDIVTVVDEEGVVVYESPSVAEVLGYEQGSTVGRSPLGYVHPDDRDRVTEQFYRALAEPDAAPTLEYRYLTAGGDWVWLESRTRALPADGPVGHLLINSRDVSARKERERRLADRNERLDRFASIVSHDLRNPLSVIRGSIEMARLNGDTEPLERGERAVDRIDQLVSELLTLARQGTGIDEPTEFGLASVARDAWETAGVDGAELAVAESARVRGDRGRVRQAFENLFRNADEHAAPTAGGTGLAEGGSDGAGDDGGSNDGDDGTADPALTVLVTATERGFLVADDGVGVDPDHRDAVFDSGFTTRPDGTGYGLDIVREVVESHGWSIELRTAADGPVDLPDGRRLRPPEGACFEVRAPGPEDGDLWIAP